MHPRMNDGGLQYPDETREARNRISLGWETRTTFGKTEEGLGCMGQPQPLRFNRKQGEPAIPVRWLWPLP